VKTGDLGNEKVFFHPVFRPSPDSFLARGTRLLIYRQVAGPKIKDQDSYGNQGDCNGNLNE